MNTKWKWLGIFFLATLVFSIFSVSSAQEVNQNVSQEVSISSTVSNVKLDTNQNVSVEPGVCGPMDLVIVLDNTGSMGGAISNIKDELPTIISNAQTASGGDLRVGYITFNDSVIVHNDLTTDTGSVMDLINATSAAGGDGVAEASDEAKNTSVNKLPAGERPDAAGNTGTQVGDFTTPYRSDALKLIILITDAPPGGFNDLQDPQDNAAMHNHAVTAKNKGILISDVFVPTGGDYAGQAAILEDDANTTGGLFITTYANGTGTSAAINEIISECGGEVEPEPVPALTPIGLTTLAGSLGLVTVIMLRRR